MALTDYYVDPSIAANSGSGTIGDPYGDLQYALDSITRNTTDGDRINIKSGTAEVLTGSLSFATYGTPSILAGLVLQGYASAQGDGGIAEIDGNGNNVSANSNVSYVDLKIHNGAATGDLIRVSGAVAVNCEVYDAYVGIDAGSYSSIVNCYIHNCDHYGMELTGSSTGAIASNCYVRSRSTDSRGAMTTGIQLVGRPTFAERCIVSCDSTTDGIYCTQDGTSAINCSIISDGGTGNGIVFNSSAIGSGCSNSLIEGFSGVGGAGIHWVDSTPGEAKGIVAYNTIFNCTTALSGDNDVVMYKSNNTTVGSSPFKKSGADTFANRFTYFEPNASFAGLNLTGNGSRGAVAARDVAASPKHPLARF
jgi:hypothetical protein